MYFIVFHTLEVGVSWANWNQVTSASPRQTQNAQSFKIFSETPWNPISNQPFPTIYQEPICPLFLVQKKVFSNQNKGHLGSRYVYILDVWW